MTAVATASVTTDAGCTTPGCLCWMFGECDAPTVEQPEPATKAANTKRQPTGLTVGTRRTESGTDTGYAYTGLIRIGRKVAADCGHLHRNRDKPTHHHGRSARGCAERILNAARRPDYATEIVTEVRDGWMRQQSGPWQVTAAMVEQFKANCARDADLLAEKIAALRTLVIEED